MTEPCPRCPEFVVRCGHLGEGYVTISRTRTDEGWRFQVVSKPGLLEGSLMHGSGHPTRAEADAEFERREEALLT